MTTKHTRSTAGRDSALNRRGFLAGATAMAVTAIKPQLVRGSQANSKLRIGLIGCGGRGSWIANLFVQNGNYQLVAAADYFQDRVDTAGKRFGIEPGRRFTGLSGYKRLLDTKPDAVVVESPPYFHPEHAHAAVEAGCHTYVAKPIAVDVPGCLTIEASGRKATENKRCFLVDFQTRANDLYREAVRRVHAGDIGPIASGEAVYYCGITWGGGDKHVLPGDAESRLRFWGVDRVLSGDVITEQNIHALDVATWIINDHPLKAFGQCGRNGRPAVGTCNCHFAVIYQFPKDVLLTFASKQYGSGYDDIGCRVYGPDGTIDTHYFGLVMIRGKKSYKGGKLGNLYTEGTITNIADFHAAITKQDYSNPTVGPSVRSNLTTILGRTAAYKKAEVTWDEMLRTAEKLEFATQGLKG